MSTAHNSDNNEQGTVTAEEQARRCEAMLNALAQVRLEGLEPAPIFFTSAERYARGELTIEEAVADYITLITHRPRAMESRLNTPDDGGNRYSHSLTVFAQRTEYLDTKMGPLDLALDILFQQQSLQDDV